MEVNQRLSQLLTSIDNGSIERQPVKTRTIPTLHGGQTVEIPSFYSNADALLNSDNERIALIGDEENNDNSVMINLSEMGVNAYFEKNSDEEWTFSRIATTEEGVPAVNVMESNPPQYQYMFPDKQAIETQFESIAADIQILLADGQSIQSFRGN